MIRRFEVEFDPIQTEDIILVGGPFQNYKSVDLYINQVYKNLKTQGFTKTDAAYLVHNYGKQTDIILDKFDELKEKNIELRLLKAEVWFTIQHEMTCTPTDFFMRRTGRLFFDKPSVDTYKNEIFKEFKNYFNWNKETTQKHEEELNTKINLTTTFN